MIRKKKEHPNVSSDTVRLGPNVYWNEDEYRWDTIDHDKDSFVIDIVNNFSEEGYISIQRAPATSGEPSFTELIRIDHSGDLLLRTGNVKIT